MVPGRGFKDLPAQRGRFTHAACAGSENKNVQFGSKRCHKARILPQPFEERHRRLPSTLQALGKRSAPGKRQELLCRPKGGGRGTGSRTFQTDLSQMQLRRTEIRVRRIVLIEPPHTWIAKQDTSAPVRL